MPEQFILIPGRSSRQGVTLNEGKYTEGYIDETSILRMHPDDMRKLGVSEGDDVRMWNEVGEVVVPCTDAGDECPQGLIFICYGDKSSQLMPGETHGSGMPDSKGLDVFLLPASQPRPPEPPAAAEAEKTPPTEPPVAERETTDPPVETAAPTSLPTEADAVSPAVQTPGDSRSSDSQTSDGAASDGVSMSTESDSASRQELGPTIVMLLLVLVVIALAALINLGG